MFNKTIRHAHTQVLSRISIRKNRYFSEAAKWTQIIQSTYMVIMFVSNKHCIYGTKPGGTYHLLPKIWTTIYQKGSAIIGMQQS